MNEYAAQEVLFIRAVEAADAAGEVLTMDDRGYAARAAAELVRWQAADQRERATAEAFVAKRAQLLAAKLAERSPKATRAVKATRWRPWIGIALPLAAFAIGAAVEHIAERRQMNILAFPLLGLIAWNVAIYVVLLVSGAMSLARHSSSEPGWLERLVAGAGSNIGARVPGPLARAVANFGVDWVRRSAPLLIARAARVLHLSAALLALGAIAGLYVRGLAFEYRAGWESTFLGVDAVHAILAFFLQPAAVLIGQPLPGVEQLATLQWGSGGTGENAGRWIHLYTATVMMIVVLPRLVLAAIAAWRERRLHSRFPLSIDEPYFRRVLSDWRESPAHVRVIAYAYTPAEGASDGMQRLAAHLFGHDVRVHFARPVAFGDENRPVETAVGESPAPNLVIALFNLASTPETENHGVFLDTVRSHAPGAVAAIVDESAYRRRLGAQAGAATRLAERRDAWTGLVATRGLRAVFVDLEAPDLSAAEYALNGQFANATAPS